MYQKYLDPVIEMFTTGEYYKEVFQAKQEYFERAGVVYEDDGDGFTYDPLQSGLGLDNIESRIQSINGTLKFESGNFGISYTIDIPVTINKEVV